MSENCNHDCSSCGTTCGEDTRTKIPYEEPNELSNIRHTIAIVSGKGGVGKSKIPGDRTSVCDNGQERPTCRNYGCRYYRSIHP